MGASSGTVAVGGDIALAGGDGELHAEVDLLVQRAEHQIGIEDFDVGDWLDLAGRDFARTLLAQRQALGTFGMHAQRDLLHVEHDVGDVLAHARDGGEFVQHALDLDRGDGGALQRRQQHAAQRVAERQAEAALQRFGGDGGGTARIMTGFDLELLRLDQFLPVFLKHVFLIVSRTCRTMPIRSTG